MNNRYSYNIEEIATFGLDEVDPDEKIEVNLKNLLYVFLTLQEYQRFFHQPLHYQSLEDVNKFLGSVNDRAGYKLLHTSIHVKMAGMFPKHIEDKFDEGDFDSKELPFYFDEGRTET